METKYGELPIEILNRSLDRLIAKVYKILPMKEEDCVTLGEYIEGTIRELVGTKEIVNILKEHDEFLSLLGILENLINESEKRIYKKDVFKAITLIKKIKEELV